MSKKNLLEICLSPDLGGLELYMMKSAKSLAEEFNVLSIIGKKTKLDKYYMDTRHKFEKLPRTGSFSLYSSYLLAKIIDMNNIDIIHIHWTKDIPIVVIAKLLAKNPPKVIQTRHMTMTRFKNDFYHRFLYKHIDMMLPVTNELLGQIEKFIPEDIRPRTELLYLGCDIVKPLINSKLLEYKKSLGVQTSFMIGIVGRINEFKGQFLLVEAMKILIDKGYDIKAYIVGHAMDNTYLETLKMNVEKNEIQNNLYFLGFEKDPYRFMQACDTILMTSKCETFGLVTIEAMSVETAVIGANTCGVLEIIDDETNGLLFEEGSISSLVEKIELLYNNSDFKEQLAREGRKKIEKVFENTKQFKKLGEKITSLVE